MHFNRQSRWLFCTLSMLAIAACDGSKGAKPTPGENAAAGSSADAGAAPGGAAGSTPATSTFDHPGTLGGDILSASQVIRNFEELGPPAYQARVPSCKKLCYACVGKILVQLGLNESSAAFQVWRASKGSLGGPNYTAYIQESAEVSAGAASRLFDIFVQAAPDIIAASPAVCGAPLFGPVDCSRGDGGCRADGLACVMGVPATDKHLAACNHAVCKLADAQQGQQLALAAALSAVHTCE